MRENRLRQIWQTGGTALNGWLHIASSYAAETMAHAGWDSLTIDMQHGPVGFESAVSMLQAISTTATVPLARVPWNEPGVIMRMLDAGCYAIICPMINSRAECEAFVGACHYPPHGYRSHGPNRAKLYGGSDYASQANETVVTMAMIETAAAMQNLDDILTTPGLDAIYVGPADLSRSLGGPPDGDLNKPLVADSLDRILAACQQHGIVPGIHTGSAQFANQMVAKGFQFVTVSSDAGLLSAKASEVITAVKGHQSTPATTSPY
ncbi:MAG: 2,4-dihydroxyhept-2-ene-1,7-dioic acid aldolase [Ardenticatenaceae bacterium]|nr:2,4-dihydroxyhept-2-ene-1,7-dioic acid aldolase [Ardenticatenaceae bacterium]